MNEEFFSSLYVSGIKIRERNDECYAFFLPIFKDFNSLKFNKNVTFFCGENGSGKSTLLEAIAVSCGFNAEGGTKNFNFSTSETHSDLYKFLSVEKGIKKPKDGFFLRAESFYNVASNIDELDKIMPLLSSYGGKSLHKQSHGESFISLVANRFGGNGLYILDEPEAALSPMRQMSLLSMIYQLVEDNSQFIIATHSPILMAFPDADIFAFDDDKITLTSYKETENYTVTKQFLDNPERMVRYLFNSQ
ncbi:MAG: AAA family ATPase [Oscillospiraceae bacterium]